MALINQVSYTKSMWIVSDGNTPFVFESGQEPDAIFKATTGNLTCTIIPKNSQSEFSILLNQAIVYSIKVKSVLGSISEGVLLALWH